MFCTPCRAYQAHAWNHGELGTHLHITHILDGNPGCIYSVYVRCARMQSSRPGACICMVATMCASYRVQYQYYQNVCMYSMFTLWFMHALMPYACSRSSQERGARLEASLSMLETKASRLEKELRVGAGSCQKAAQKWLATVRFCASHVECCL